MTRQWERFYCSSCGWETVGTYALSGGEPCLPDTDCPKCGSHDSVLITDQPVPPPADPDAVRRDQNTGPYAK